jgi:hypothetical protein
LREQVSHLKQQALTQEGQNSQLTHKYSTAGHTLAGPTPTNISRNSEPEMLKNGTPASPAVALASKVFPVPGGPDSIAPYSKSNSLTCAICNTYTTILRKVNQPLEFWLQAQYIYEGSSRNLQIP